MEQKPVQFCVECGNPLTPGQRFCASCGATVNTNAINPTAASSSGQSGATQLAPRPPTFGGSGSGQSNPQAYPRTDSYTTNDQGLTPPPPPPSSTSPTNNSYPTRGPEAQFYSQNVNSGPTSFPQNSGPTSFPQNSGPASFPQNSGQPSYVQPQPMSTVPPVVPQYAQKPRRSNCGCIAVSIILLVVLAIGFGTFFIFTRLRTATNTNTQVGNTPASQGTSASNTPSGTTILSSEVLNLKVTYASVNLTIISLQMAHQFADDTSNTDQAAVVRINLDEKNAVSGNPDYAESDALYLILPDNTAVQSTQQQASVSPGQGIDRKNWLDYPLTSQVKLDQLTLRLGTQTENQMILPLKPGADLSKYADKTVNPGTKFQYAGLNWTLNTATQSYSYNATQATINNRYVIITLAAINNSADGFENSPGSYMRLQAAGVTLGPDSTSTFPLSIPTQTNGQGIVAFLMPQNATAFTLIMLAQAGSPAILCGITQIEVLLQ